MTQASVDLNSQQLSHLNIKNECTVGLMAAEESLRVYDDLHEPQGIWKRDLVIDEGRT